MKRKSWTNLRFLISVTKWAYGVIRRDGVTDAAANREASHEFTLNILSLMFLFQTFPYTHLRMEI